MVVIVNSKDKLPEQIVVIEMTDQLQKVVPVKILDDITRPLGGIGVKKNNYWLIGVKDFLKNSYCLTRNPLLTQFMASCKDKIFTSVMFKI